MRRTPLLALLVTVVLVATACGGAEEVVDTTASSTTVPETSTTTTLADTTTTAGSSVTVDGGTPGLVLAVESLFGDRSGVDPAFADHLAGATAGSSGPIEFTATTGTVAEAEVAVLTDGTDVLYAVSEAGDAWTIVGGSLESLGASPWYGAEPIQLYVIGSDARPGQSVTGYRADSHHIVTIAPDASSASIVGIPRDAYVETPEGRNSKFTNVMASNGPERVVATAEILTDLEFQGYLVTGFQGFVELVDEFGGFEVDVPVPMNDDAAKAYLRAGVQYLNGTDMLAFARTRKTIEGGDFTRQFHHGVIMQWGMAAVQEEGVAAVPALLEMLERHTIHDLTATELLLVGGAIQHLDPFATTNVVVPASNGSAGGAYVARLQDGAFEIFADLADGPYVPTP